MRTLQFVFLCVLFSSVLTAQYKVEKNTRIFDDTHVHRIDILIDTAHISELLNNPDSSIMHPANFIIRHASESDTINNIGFRIKGRTSRYNPKKSFKLSFNEYEKGRKYDGVEALKQYITFGSSIPTPLSQMHLYPIRGAASRIVKEETPWAYRDAKYAGIIVDVDPNPNIAEKITNWCKDYWEALHPYSSGGANSNFIRNEGRIASSQADNSK